MSLKKLFPVVLFAAVTGIVSPQAQGDYSGVYGHGLSSCGTWTEDLRKGPDWISQDEIWVQGFISGASSVRGVTTRRTDRDGIRAFMTSYCQEHPLSRIADGASALVSELRQRGR